MWFQNAVTGQSDERSFDFLCLFFRRKSPPCHRPKQPRQNRFDRRKVHIWIGKSEFDLGKLFFDGSLMISKFPGSTSMRYSRHRKGDQCEVDRQSNGLWHGESRQTQTAHYSTIPSTQDWLQCRGKNWQISIFLFL